MVCLVICHRCPLRLGTVLDVYSRNFHCQAHLNDILVCVWPSYAWILSWVSWCNG